MPYPTDIIIHIHEREEFRALPYQTFTNRVFALKSNVLLFVPRALIADLAAVIASAIPPKPDTTAEDYRRWRRPTGQVLL